MTMPQSWTATTLVQRTTPVSVSTETSATCTPPTPLLESPGVQLPVPLTESIPSLAQASFHDQPLPFSRLLPRLTILPASTPSSSFFTPRRGAIFSKSASRAALAAFRNAGAVPGQVVLPP